MHSASEEQRRCFCSIAPEAEAAAEAEDVVDAGCAGCAEAEAAAEAEDAVDAGCAGALHRGHTAPASSFLSLAKMVFF